MHEKSLYKKNMKKDLYNIEIDIDEDIKRDIEDFYFSKNDLDNIKIPLDLEDLIEEPFEEEKQEKKTYYFNWFIDLLLVSLLLLPIVGIYNPNIFVKFENVKKVYMMGEIAIEALKDATFEINKGEICVIVGPSGAGKTTLLNILGGMDTLTSGSVWLDGNEISKYSQKQLTSYRRYDIGFVFQFYNLVQNLTALENVSLATQICKNPMDSAEALDKVGLSNRLNNFPSQLSGGEQQRVAIARALAKNPKLLLCDEPTGALDYNTGKAILKLLSNTARQTGMTVIIITHNLAIAPMADRIIHVKNGTVDSVEINENPVPIEQIEW